MIIKYMSKLMNYCLNIEFIIFVASNYTALSYTIAIDICLGVIDYLDLAKGIIEC